MTTCEVSLAYVLVFSTLRTSPNASHDNLTKGILQLANNRPTISTALSDRACCCLQNASSLSSGVTALQSCYGNGVEKTENTVNSSRPNKKLAWITYQERIYPYIKFF